MVVPPFLSLLPMAGRRAEGGVSSAQGRPVPMSPRAGDGALPKQGGRVSFLLHAPSRSTELSAPSRSAGIRRGHNAPRVGAKEKRALGGWGWRCITAEEAGAGVGHRQPHCRQPRHRQVLPGAGMRPVPTPLSGLNSPSWPRSARALTVEE